MNICRIVKLREIGMVVKRNYGSWIFVLSLIYNLLIWSVLFSSPYFKVSRPRFKLLSESETVRRRPPTHTVYRWSHYNYLFGDREGPIPLGLQSRNCEFRTRIDFPIFWMILRVKYCYWVCKISRILTFQGRVISFRSKMDQGEGVRKFLISLSLEEMTQIRFWVMIFIPFSPRAEG